MATLLLVPGVKYDDIHQNRSKTCIIRIITIYYTVDIYTYILYTHIYICIYLYLLVEYQENRRDRMVVKW